MTLALTIVACILLLLAAISKFDVASSPYVRIGWLGLFFFVLSFIWGKV